MDVAHIGESNRPDQYEQSTELRSANTGADAQVYSERPKQARSRNRCSCPGRLPHCGDQFCEDARHKVTKQPEPSSVHPFSQVPDKGNRREVERDLVPSIGMKE